MVEVTPNTLQKGDRFIEDTYPEIWEVTGKAIDPECAGGVHAKVVDYLKGYPGERTRIGEESDWWGVGMTLYRLSN